MKRQSKAVNFAVSGKVDEFQLSVQKRDGLSNWLRPPPWAPLLELLLPCRCALCGNNAVTRMAPFNLPMELCRACRAQLPWLESACLCCAEPLTESSLCGRCLKQPPAFQRSIVPLRYEGVVARWVLAFKYHHQLASGRLLAQLMVHTISHIHTVKLDSNTACQAAFEWPQLLVPVPMHPRRLAQRGYNQAALLAQDLSRYLGLPWAALALNRTRATVAQSGLSEHQRRGNLQHAFSADKGLPRHVALVDDVITTTSTARACAEALRSAGVELVSVWAAARTP